RQPGAQPIPLDELAADRVRNLSLQCPSARLVPGVVSADRIGYAFRVLLADGMLTGRRNRFVETGDVIGFTCGAIRRQQRLGRKARSVRLDDRNRGWRRNELRTSCRSRPRSGQKGEGGCREDTSEGGSANQHVRIVSRLEAGGRLSVIAGRYQAPATNYSLT